MVSHKYKAIFVHIPRTGGHSITALLDYKLAEVPKTNRVIRHAFPVDYQAKFPNEWNNYLKFVFIRNPYDRLISAWIRCSTLYTDSKFIKFDHRDDDKFFLEEVKPEFNRFVKENLKFLLDQAHLRPQSLWFENAEYDFVGNTNDLDRSVEKLSGLLGIAEKEIKRFSITKRRDYEHYYTEESYKIVKELYSQDFEIWEKYKDI